MKCNLAQRFDGKRSAFTLIEMLVSSALVVLIMSLFAQIFALATASITDQRTVARHDQSARVLTQTISTDLLGRTFRQRRDAVGLARGVVPLFPDDAPDADRQRGYLYISENDPLSRVDDVLQFTADLTNVRSTSFSGDGQLPLTYSGRAAMMGRPDIVNFDGVSDGDDLLLATGAGNAAAAAALAGATLADGSSLSDIDQPDGDDGQLNNGRTQSRFAEISYFLRGGNLYRRVLLLRDLPEGRTGDGQPSLGPNGEFGPLLSFPKNVDDMLPQQRLPHNYVAPVDIVAPFANWYNDFDVAATRYEFDPENDGFGDADGDGTTDTSATFVHSVKSLDNTGGSRPFGQPWNRFGHFPNADRDFTYDGTPDVQPATGVFSGRYLPGQPYEYLRVDFTTPTLPFFGRFTIGECSSPAFGFPSINLPAASHPYHARADVGGHIDVSLDSDTEVTAFAGGPRKGEDIVLTNVMAFDVEVWDDALQRFVDIGEFSLGGLYTDTDSATSGFQSNYQLNPFYGPNSAAAGLNRVFDTWHPDIDGYDGFANIPDPPPIYITQQALSSRLSVAANVGTQGPNEQTARNTVAGQFEGHWDTKNTYQAGDVVIADLTIPPFATATAPYGSAPQAIAETASVFPASGLARAAFVAEIRDTNGDTNVDTSHQSPNRQPNWNLALANGYVDQPAFNPSDDGIRWTLLDQTTGDAFAARNNQVGLKKLRVTVSVRDPKSDTVRDLTLIHSFVE